MSGAPTYELRTPTIEDDWRAYHSIRRKVLFENRGQFGVYDQNHPDEHSDGNHPLLLIHNGEPIGVIRVDIRGTLAILRRVAIREDLQAQDMVGCYSRLRSPSRVERAAIK